MGVNSLSSTRRTVIQGNVGHAYEVRDDIVVPQLGEHDILVRTIAVAINPTDHKMPVNFPSPGAIVGCDFAGVVAAAGSGVPENFSVRVGDRVAGAAHGSNPIDHSDGAFSEYVRASADLVFHVPETMSWEEAAAIGGTGHGSLCLVLWRHLNLPGTPQHPSETAEHVLVYGGSTSTGTMALQLLTLSGFHPIAVCSPHNFELAKAYGAEAVFDYSSPTVAKDIRSYTKNALFYAVDCITDEASAIICYEAIGRAGGRYVSLEYCPPHLQVRTAITATFALGYEMFGKPVALSGPYEREANLAARDAAVDWYKVMTSLCQRNMIKAHPVRSLPGKWQGVLKGIEILRKGGVSGQKLTVRVD